MEGGAGVHRAAIGADDGVGLRSLRGGVEEDSVQDKAGFIGRATLHAAQDRRGAEVDLPGDGGALHPVGLGGPLLEGDTLVVHGLRLAAHDRRDRGGGESDGLAAVAGLRGLGKNRDRDEEIPHLALPAGFQERAAQGGSGNLGRDRMGRQHVEVADGEGDKPVGAGGGPNRVEDRERGPALVEAFEADKRTGEFVAGEFHGVRWVGGEILTVRMGGF